MIIVVNVLVNSIVRTIDDVTLGLESVANNKSKKNIIPVTVNDEVGDIVQAFNKIQKQNQNRVETINDNQNSLIERERLALLGQMVGGIAHNLKTPIFSIAGGLEGLNDLIKEYKESIEDPNVTDEDMHAIAKEEEKKKIYPQNVITDKIVEEKLEEKRQTQLALLNKKNWFKNIISKIKEKFMARSRT